MIDIDKDNVAERARELAADYVPKYWGCAQSSFMAVVDALREYGLEIATPADAEEMYKGLVGLSGGYANMGRGNCGALSGAAFAISLYSGIDKNKQIEDKDYRRIPFDNVADTIGQKFVEEFGGLMCRDVTWKRFGKWYNSWNPVIKEEFCAEENARGCIGKEKCTISWAAGWAAGFIADLEKNPNTLEKMKAKYGEVH